MDIIIRGFVTEQSVEFQKQKSVLKACANAGVSLPKETAAFFGISGDSDDIDDQLIRELEEEYLEREIPCEEVEGGVYEIIVSEIPKDVYKLRIESDD